MKTEKYIEQLVTMRSLSLLFYNFTQEQIKELKQVREFNHVWSELEAKAKRKKWFSIPDTEFYNVFCNVSYETQAHIIEVALNKYEGEARNGIGFAAILKNMADKHIKEGGENV